MRRATRVPMVLAAALIVVGCLDFEPVTAPVQPAVAPAQLYVDARFAGGHSLGPGAVPVRLGVQVFPGRDEQGPRPLLGDTLWIDDQPILPAYVGRGGERSYFYEGAAPEAPELRLRLPRLGRVGSAAAKVRLHRAAPLVTDTLRIAPDQDLVVPLHVPSAGETTGSAVFQQWTLQVVGSTGRFDFSQQGDPPATAVVPPAMRPEPTVDGLLHVEFVHHLHRRPVADPDMQIDVVQSTRLAWVVEVVAPPEIGAPP